MVAGNVEYWSKIESFLFLKNINHRLSNAVFVMLLRPIFIEISKIEKFEKNWKITYFSTFFMKILKSHQAVDFSNL